MSDLKSCQVKGSCEKTSVSNGSYVFEWAIENFPIWPTDYDFESERFELFNYNYFHINLTKKKLIKGFPNLCCLLKLVWEGYDEVVIDLGISISDSAGNIFLTKSDKRFCTRRNTENSFEFSSIKMDKFTNETQDKILILKFALKYFTISTEVFIKHPMPSPSDNLPAIVKNFKVMYDNSLYTDVNLIVADDVVRAHKSVLSASSPVFAKMLSSPMDENSTDAIEITDIEFAILKAFVEFLYAGNIPDSFDSVCGLYYAADKYDVRSLRMVCSKIMLAKLDIENACRVLSLANRHSDVLLKNSVLEFMKFEFDAIVKTDVWIEFAKSEVELAAKVKK